MNRIKKFLPNRWAIFVAIVFFAITLVLSFSQLLSLWLGVLLLFVGLVFGLLLNQIDREFLHHLYRSDPNDGLVTQSILFLGLFFLLSVFVVTSTGSLLGGGIIIGFLANTTASMFALKNSPEQLQSTFFFQLKRPIEKVEILTILSGMVVWNALIWFFALFK